MIEYIQYYLIVGALWSLIHTIIIGDKNITTGYQIRLLLFWPITMAAWVIGFIEAMVQTWNDLK
tara:strand:+ start:3121 stop:3312 length:192 start_codon:yes stop_codon:yes gene_type:complete